MFQAKGFPYRLADLFGDEAAAQAYADGCYVTLRLRSDMYHRFHAPHDGRIEQVTHHRGDTWNVNPIALKRVERLYCRNERATIRLRLDAGGHVLTLVPVAAILVASLRLHCIDLRLHLGYRGPQHIDCDARVVKGQELGWFEHGSTIIVFAPPGFTLCPGIEPGATVRMGQRLMHLPDLQRTATLHEAVTRWLQHPPASPLEAAMAHIDLIYFNAGGGHRAAAEALREVMVGEGSPWQVRLLNLFELLDPQDRFRRITGMPPEAYYNRRLARGWTLGMAQELKLLQAAIRLAHPRLVQRLQQHWQRSPPDLAVSLVPNFNLALSHSLQAVRPGLPFVTVLTDLADLPPHFWVERGAGQHVVCGTERALQQARAMGVDARHLHRASGMILRPSFYRNSVEPRAGRAARTRPGRAHAHRRGAVRRPGLERDARHRRAPERRAADPDVRPQPRPGRTGCARSRPRRRG